MSKKAAAITAIREYSSAPFLRALVNLIPYVGGSMDILITSQHEKIVNERLEKLLNGLRESISILQEEQINLDFLKTEGAHDLLFLSFEKASRIRDKERINAISEIIVDALKKESQLRGNPIDAVLLLGELSEQEAYVLSKLYYVFAERKDLLTGSINTLVTIDSIAKVVDSSIQYDLPIVLNRLAGKGLVGTNFEYFSLPDYTKHLIETTNLRYA